MVMDVRMAMSLSLIPTSRIRLRRSLLSLTKLRSRYNTSAIYGFLGVERSYLRATRSPAEYTLCVGGRTRPFRNLVAALYVA